MFCANCGSALDERWKACPKCGVDVARQLEAEKSLKEPLKIVCKECGKEMDNSWNICPYCQTNTTQNETNESQEEIVEKTISEWGEGIAFLLILYKTHPIRFLMCIPVWIYAAYLTFAMNVGSSLITHGFGKSFGEILGYMLFLGVCSWLVYGPINLRKVRDTLKNIVPIHIGGNNEEEIVDSDEDAFFILLFQKHPIRFFMCVLVWIRMICVILSMNIDDLFTFAGALQILGYVSFAMACSWCLYGPVNLREVRCIAERKEIKNLGILNFVLYIVLAVLLIPCGDESEDYTQAGTYMDNYTIEEYLGNCTPVDLETLARNPEQYIGEHIIVEGSLGTTLGVLHVGMWTTTNPLIVEYDGVAYDTNLNEIGNVLDDDYGYVAGELIDEDTIKAAIVIVE